MEIDYLRLSLTDRCNLNCIYCTPSKRSRFLSSGEMLDDEELAAAAVAFVKAGVRKIRLTGGEPLIKKNIAELVGMFRSIEGLEELAMTTNGLGLKASARKLRGAGLDRVNISIDTLKREKYKSITGSDGFDEVRQGITESLAAGFSQVKLNVILMKGINDDEISDFARLTVDYPLAVRFIEFFPTNKRSAEFAGSLIGTEEVKKKIESCFGAMSGVGPVKGNGPARYYGLKEAKGALGFISGSSENFCSSCNRIRMDCSGKIYPCLFSPATHELKDLLRNTRNVNVLAWYIKKAFLVKSEYRKDTASVRQLEMSRIGG